MINPPTQTRNRPRRAAKRQPQQKDKQKQRRRNGKRKISYPLWIENLLHNLEWIIPLVIVELLALEGDKPHSFWTLTFLFAAWFVISIFLYSKAVKQFLLRKPMLL